MCIIVIKPAGQPMPSIEIIQRCWTNNSDGAGFMYPSNGKVRIEKGFMTYTSLTDRLKELANQTDITAPPMILHFRIGTHGGNTPENCHPFPISAYPAVLEKINSTASLAVAHNGIIPGVIPRPKISDTMEYILTQLAPLHQLRPDFYKLKTAQEMIYNATRSKLAFMDSDGRIETIGAFLKVDSILYSNTGYLAYTYYPKWNNGTYASDDDYYDDLSNMETTPKQTAIAKTPPDLVYLMMLDDNDGYIKTANGKMLSGENYLINGQGHVYYYNERSDNVIPMPTFTALNHSNLPMKIDWNRIKAYHKNALVQPRPVKKPKGGKEIEK